MYVPENFAKITNPTVLTKEKYTFLLPQSIQVFRYSVVSYGGKP